MREAAAQPQSTRSTVRSAMALWALMAGIAVGGFAQPDDACVVQDDGTGSAELPPPLCAYQSPDEVLMIIDGLPPGTTIELEPIYQSFICPKLGDCGVPGGDLGGEVEDFDAALILIAEGTGDLDGFSRLLAVPTFSQTHSGPRNPGDPVQSFPTDLVILQGLLPPGDPDFANLQLLAGSGFGLPSPGQTTLTRLGPPGSDFQVDSIFDVSYQITFTGAPGGALEGLGGTTNGTVRIDATGERQPCVADDDGTGTVELPPEPCDYLSPLGQYEIIDGLPPGTTLELDPRHTDFVCDAPADCGQPGGNLGGEVESFESALVLQLAGTNALGNFRRTLRLPTTVETHSGPRTPGDPLQSFVTELFSLEGSLPAGDPDFDALTITAGTDNGYPSPGHTTLTDLGGGTFHVDSFFDITYQIDFVGAPGGALDGLSGTTVGRVRVTARSGKTDSVEADNGLGTATLPPEGGEYVAGDQLMQIIDGLPPGTEIELDPSLWLFFCQTTPCGITGGGLGGSTELFDATLDLALRGTGSLTGFQRNLQVPMTVRTDSGPYTPGDPVHVLDAEIISLQGQIFGDPDFDELTIVAGSANGLPSPGHTTLTDQADGTFLVDSFFDIDYRIDFVGAPGGQLDGLSGSTTGEVRLTACEREDPQAPPRNVTIVKEADPQGTTLFPFTGLASTSLLDNGSSPNWRTFNNLSPGVYTVAESLPGGAWMLDDILCVDPDAGTTVDLAAAEATIDLDLGEAVLCTFDNRCTDDLVLAGTTLTGTRAYKSSGTATLGPSLVVDGTAIDVAAQLAVMLQAGTEIRDGFVARNDAALVCP